MSDCLKLGDSAEITRVFKAEDMVDYAALTGSALVSQDVPEPLVCSLWSYLLGVVLPGPGTNYLKQDTDFIGIAEIGAALTARVTLTRIRLDKGIVDFLTECFGPDGDLIATGRALVQARDTGRLPAD
jgi:hypothetical protein